MKTTAKDFKMTELGPIPKDWEVKQVDEFAEVTTGNRNTQDAQSNGAYPFYVRSPIVERIDDYSFDTAGVVTAGDGVGTGKIFHFVQGKFGLHQRAYLIYDFDGVDAKYFYWVFSRNFYDRIMQMTAKSSVDSVRREMITGMEIALPPLPEQRKIAAALSDVDEMIAALEKLIEKKRKIKTGAMQRLLTGKTRLPGFKGAWVEKRLGDCGEWIGGGTPSTQNAEYWNGHIPWISSSDLEEGNVYHINKTRFISESAVRNSATSKCPQGALLIIARVGVGKVAIADKELCTSQDFSNLVVEDKTDVRFLAYLLSVVMARMKEATQGTSIKGVSLEDMKALALILPPTLAEQKAIAKVLGDMDDEIAALEAELAKTRQLKQGMMQELLTGKVRLG